MELGTDPFTDFVLFFYPEIKDLLKHFLTLISATLVFSIAFAEKIVSYETSDVRQRMVVFGSWTLLVVALACCGLGIYLNYQTAVAAVSAMNGGSAEAFRSTERLAYFFQDLAALLYVAGLGALVGSALVRRAKN